MKAKLRPGNVYTSNGVVEFIKPLIKHYNEKFPETTPFIRGDSGFAVPALYDLCEKESVYYGIRLKSNANLQRLADELHPSAVLLIPQKRNRFMKKQSIKQNHVQNLEK